ncbi:MAG: alpha/beta hydrolase, partial [Gemmatimonadetes bacterium]|nr:alpha/beta hydrolase [Gemmatimonadota bacterium]
VVPDERLRRARQDAGVVPPAETAARPVIVEVNGVRLFTRRVGAGPLVVVLHGGPGAHHDYLLPQFDLLARGRELCYYDQRGGGQSPVARETSVGWREHVADLEALRAHVGLEHLTLCGYSWGGLLAVLYTLEHPDRVSRLALVSPASPTVTLREEFERHFAERMSAPEIVLAREELRASGLRERDPTAYQKRAFELSVAGYFHRFEDAARLTPFRVTARTQQAVWNSLGEYDLRDRLRASFSRLPPPVSRIIHGSFDPIPIAGSRELAALLGADLVELPVGHCPHVETTDDFVRALDTFLPHA